MSIKLNMSSGTLHSNITSYHSLSSYFNLLLSAFLAETCAALSVVSEPGSSSGITLLKIRLSKLINMSSSSSPYRPINPFISYSTS
jgi:hypothetical protein